MIADGAYTSRGDAALVFKLHHDFLHLSGEERLGKRRLLLLLLSRRRRGMEFDTKTRLFLNDVESESFIDAVNDTRLFRFRVVQSGSTTRQRLSSFDGDRGVASLGSRIGRPGSRQGDATGGRDGGGDLGLTGRSE